MQENRGTTGQKKHWYEHVPKSVETRQGGIVESTSTNCQNYHQQQTRHYNPS